MDILLTNVIVKARQSVRQVRVNNSPSRLTYINFDLDIVFHWYVQDGYSLGFVAHRYLLGWYFHLILY